MPKRTPLSNWCLVEDRGHSSDEVIVEDGFAHVDATFLRLPYFVTDGRLDLLVEPVIKAIYRQDGEALPGDIKAEAWLGVRQALPEREDIGTHRYLSQCRDDADGVLEVFVPLVFEADNCGQTSS